jgi:hypothetical protein
LNDGYSGGGGGLAGSTCVVDCFTRNKEVVDRNVEGVCRAEVEKGRLVNCRREKREVRR